MGPHDIAEHLDIVISVALVGVVLLASGGVFGTRSRRATLPSPARRGRRWLALCVPVVAVLAIMALRLTRPQQAWAAWNEFRGDGKFSVLFPAPPEASERSEETALGRMVAYSYAARDGSGAEYRVRYSDLPEGASYKTGAGEATPDVSGMTAHGFVVTRATPNTVCGCPGSLVEGRFDGRGAVKIQFVWAGRRQYVLIWAPSDRGGDGDGDARFFSSFRVVSK